MERNNKPINGEALKQALLLLEQDITEKISIEDIVAGDNITIDLNNNGITISASALKVRGSMWYFGTAITGTSTTPLAFPASGITSAIVGDIYLSIATYNLYSCTIYGNASTAKWEYKGCIRGEDDKIAISITEPVNKAPLWINPEGQTITVSEINDINTNSDFTTLSAKKISELVMASSQDMYMLDDRTDIMAFINSFSPSTKDIHVYARLWSGYGVPTQFGYEDGRNNDFWYDVFLVEARTYGRVIAHDVHSSRTFIKSKYNGTWSSWESYRMQLSEDMDTVVKGFALDATIAKELNDKITTLEKAIANLASSSNSVIKDVTVGCFGDSITYGTGDTTYSNGGYPVRLTGVYGMSAEKLAIAGYPMQHYTDTDGIVDIILNHNFTPQKQVYIVMGGFNDIWHSNSVLGTLSSSFVDNYNINTYYGALERSFDYIHKKAPNAHIVYVTMFKLETTSAHERFMIAAQKVCSKWNIPVIDLYNSNDINGTNPVHVSTYFAADKIHLIGAGYDKLAEVIANKLKSILLSKPNIAPIPTTSPTVPSTISVTAYGADATGATYSTVAFKTALAEAIKVGKKVYVPAGTFKLKWWGEDWVEAADEMNPSLLVGNFEGVGDIIIDKFPQPGNRDTNFNPWLISTKYEDCFGKFNMSNINNPLIMDMHLTHEARSCMNMYHVNFGPVKRHYEPSTSAATHPRFNCWGQIGLRYDKRNTTLPTGYAKVNIGKIGLLVYNQGQWSVHSNPYAEDGGMFLLTYETDAGYGDCTRTTFADYVQYSIPFSALKTHLLHFWCPAWNIPNPTTIEYMVGFVECWLDSSNSQYSDYFCFNSGCDMVTAAGVTPKDHDEFATGRFMKLTTDRRFTYLHNVRYYETDSVLKYSNLQSMINNQSIQVW